MKLALRRVLEILTPAQRRGGVVLLAMMIVGMFLEMLGIGLLIPAIALLMQDDLGARYPAVRPVLELLGNPAPRELVTIAMAALVGVYLVKNLYLAFLAWQQMRFGFGVQAQLSQRLFTTYLRQPWTFHLQRNSAQLIRNVASEASMFNQVVTNSVIITAELLVLFGIASLLLAVEPLGALIVVFILGGAAWTFYRMTRAHVSRWGELRQYHAGLSTQHLMQGLGGAKDVKLSGRESNFLEQFSVHNLQGARVGQLQQTLAQLPRLWLELLAATGLATLVVTMLAQGRAMTDIVPTLALFAAAAFRLLPSVNRVLGAFGGLRFALPVIDVLHRELQLEAPEPVPRAAGAGHALGDRIELDDVTFSYPNAARAAVAGVSIVVHKGESVGFVGPSGSGKSTLVDIVLGLLDPATGRVVVDGHDIRANPRTWQDQIGYVPQSIYLTDDSLRRNVAFGIADHEIDEDAVRRAVAAAQLDGFVAELADGLDTVVGERGIRLSGGQRQRIGIARALYHDPAVLVLDEATSALDAATERDVMATVTALQGAKTLLIVAHRLSTVAHCDRLYRLEAGRIVAEGNFETVTGMKATAR